MQSEDSVPMRFSTCQVPTHGRAAQAAFVSACVRMSWPLELASLLKHNAFHCTLCITVNISIAVSCCHSHLLSHICWRALAIWPDLDNVRKQILSQRGSEKELLHACQRWSNTAHAASHIEKVVVGSYCQSLPRSPHSTSVLTHDHGLAQLRAVSEA